MGENEVRLPELISIKRDGDILSPENVRQFIRGLMNERVHHAQLGAMLMAIFLKGMNREEMVELTKAMLTSGERLEWPKEWEGLVVDKHSTGGVGDKISLPLAPALAACGLKVPMISGRSLEHTGGTLDKLESIPGYKTDKTLQEMKQALDDVGCCIVSQSATLVPADKVMYSFRDITGTVASVPLIVSSIISKKAAEGLGALVLDVKCGTGSFMKTAEAAERLAHALVATSEGLGIKTSAFITQMDHPIGLTIGNSLEVMESIDCLLGKGPKDLKDLVCIEGGELLYLSKKVSTPEEGEAKIKEVLENGAALEKFKKMLMFHCVSQEVATKICSSDVHSCGILPIAKNTTQLKVNESGFVCCIDSMKCAEVTSALGTGRTHPGEAVAMDVGLQLAVHVGTEVKAGDVWVTVYHQTSTLDANLRQKLETAIGIAKDGPRLENSDNRIIKHISAHSTKQPFPCQ